MPCFIDEGDQVVIKRDNVMKAVQIRKGRKIWLEKKVKFLADELLGKQYGSSFEVKEGHLVQVSRKQDTQEPDNGVEASGEEEGPRDNRSLTDQSDNQKMTKAEIHKLQKEGVSGENIVDQLVENSATFKTKTDYAQEKYIRKKKKKYIPVLTILQPNVRLVAELYFNRGPMRICNMRPDSLGLVLTLSNVRSGNKMLVVDSCLGLVVAAILERLCGVGSLVNVYSGSAPLLQANEAFNFTKQQLSVLENFPLDRVASLKKPGVTASSTSTTKIENTAKKLCTESGAVTAALHVDQTQEAEGAKMECSENVDEVLQEDLSKQECSDHSMDESATDAQANQSEETKITSGKRKKDDLFAVRARKREWKRKQVAAARSVIEEADMDGLIVASKFHPTPVVLNLLEFVAPGRPIVVYSQFKQPLLDCYARLRDRGGVVLLKLTETWLREYQILPNRTHPTVNMSGGGGYILTGTKVAA